MQTGAKRKSRSAGMQTGAKRKSRPAGMQNVKIQITMENKVLFKALKNSPLEVTGIFTIKGSDGKTIDAPNPSYLCRCGGSGNKPFCDGTHNRNGFHS